MLKRVVSQLVIVVVVVVLTSIFQPLSHLQGFAQSGCRTFEQTGKTVCGRFLSYWNDYGGLAQQGYPISGEFIEVSDLNGQSYTVQYFERAVFEYHPEARPRPPYDVLLSQLGTFQFKRKYPNGVPNGGSVTPTQTPASSLSFGGYGSRVSASFNLGGGTYQAGWSARPRQDTNTYSCYFKVELKSVTGGYVRTIADTISYSDQPSSGSSYLNNIAPGQYFYEVISDCFWAFGLIQ